MYNVFCHSKILSKTRCTYFIILKQQMTKKKKYIIITVISLIIADNLHELLSKSNELSLGMIAYRCFLIIGLLSAITLILKVQLNEK